MSGIAVSDARTETLLAQQNQILVGLAAKFEAFFTTVEALPQIIADLTRSTQTLNSTTLVVSQYLQTSQTEIVDLLGRLVMILESGPPSQLAGDPASIEVVEQPLPPA